MGWVGLLLFAGGLLVWTIEQRQTDKIFLNQYQKAVNEHISDTCQSCGMNLRYTTEIKKGRYCSYCFDEDSFRLPDATLDEFKTSISVRMKLQGFTDKQIKRHLNSVGNLDRWKKSFRWV